LQRLWSDRYFRFGYAGIEVHYIVLDEDLERIASKKLSKIRLYLRDAYIEEEIKGKKADSFLESAKAINL
jgi:hypothetical protein